jgi:hypothetical protein
MKTLTSRVAAPVNEDWLDSCAFVSRHNTLVRSNETLIQEFEKTAPPLQPPPKRIAFPLIDRHFETVTKSSPPAKKQLPDSLVAELHSFRQLSSPFFCPETSLDTLPEYILFGLVALLGLAWPILAMLGVMSHPWR